MTRSTSPAKKPRASEASRVEETSSLNLLRQLMSIDSPTTDAAGVDRVQKMISSRLAALGFQTSFHHNPETHSGQLLVATFAGTEPSFVTLISHADTVLSHEQFGYDFRIDEEKGTATGSGVIDNKGGLVVMLEGLTRYIVALRLKKLKPKHGLRVVISPNEEAGSVGFNESFRTFAQDSSFALGFEPALEDGSIIKSRRGNRWYEIHVQGIEAHAGRSQGEHVNAAHELAFKIVKLHKLSKPQKGVSVNVGAIQAGRDKFNVICGKATCKLDVRFTDFESRDRVHRKIEKILGTHKLQSLIGEHACEVSYSLADDCPPFASNERSRRAVKKYLKLLDEVEGVEHKAAIAGGAGDVNYMSGPDVVVLDGLGPLGGRMHTEFEFLQIDSLETRAEVLARFLASI